MKTATIIRITNNEDKTVYLTSDSELGEILKCEGIIDIRKSLLLSEKTRKGKQVAMYSIEFNFVPKFETQK